MGRGARCRRGGGRGWPGARGRDRGGHSGAARGAREIRGAPLERVWRGGVGGGRRIGRGRPAGGAGGVSRGVRPGWLGDAREAWHRRSLRGARRQRAQGGSQLRPLPWHLRELQGLPDEHALHFKRTGHLPHRWRGGRACGFHGARARRGDQEQRPVGRGQDHHGRGGARVHHAGWTGECAPRLVRLHPARRAFRLHPARHLRTLQGVDPQQPGHRPGREHPPGGGAPRRFRRVHRLLRVYPHGRGDHAHHHADGARRGRADRLRRHGQARLAGGRPDGPLPWMARARGLLGARDWHLPLVLLLVPPSWHCLFRVVRGAPWTQVFLIVDHVNLLIPCHAGRRYAGGR
mmetsp:Transcript_26075/g.76459  ORF Transcript_26075/g.76459 Transcript_26075/m.76459 type:complete len:347 (-) Transcript_26075:339-1379(-)